MPKATVKVVFHIVLQDEAMDFTLVFPGDRVRDLAEEALQRWQTKGVTFVPDGGKTMHFWPAHAIRYIDVTIHDN